MIREEHGGSQHAHNFAMSSESSEFRNGYASRCAEEGWEEVFVWYYDSVRS